MSYDNEAIRAIAEVPRKSSDRQVAIIDAAKLKNIGFRTLLVMVNELGLTSDEIAAAGEDGPTVYLIVANNEADLDRAWLNICDADGGRVADREKFQRAMGDLLGYSGESIEEFVGSEVAKTCPCACCGGEPNE
jgi:hypothetical protein